MIMYLSFITKLTRRRRLEINQVYVGTCLRNPRSITWNNNCHLSFTSTRAIEASSVHGQESVPFYGLPQKSGRNRGSIISSFLQIGGTMKSMIDQHLPSTTQQSPTLTEFIQQSTIAIRDPTRADAVAAVGEMTGRYQLLQLLKLMQNHPVGQQVLQDRPIVSKATIPYDSLIEQAQRVKKQYGTIENIPADQLTFGIAYGIFLIKHGFDPDERDDVKYLTSSSDVDIAYVMLRYRQCHDYWHVLTQLPPTVNGEIGLKLLELFHMNMPVAALSCLSQSVVILSKTSQIAGILIPNNTSIPATATNTTSLDDLHTIWNLYLPWARQQARNMATVEASLLNVYYENEFSVPLHILRQRLQLEPFKNTSK